MKKVQTKKLKTVADLQANGYVYRPIKEELALNLSEKLKKKERVFPDIHGYDDTVVPQLIHAILSGHNIAILGEKGQAKSRIMRSLTSLLDEYYPVLDGTDIPEHPLHPTTSLGESILNKDKESAAVKWIHRDDRYAERLAPGSRIADIIGDLDPSKVIAGHSLADEKSLYYGLLPRMNHGIFAVNELPDLDYLVQVAMFNVLEESDIQIRGLPIRIPLDVFVCFTANPADYIRSGKIITQLKDRIGSEIRTHYPKTRAIGLAITRQEVYLPNIEPSVRFPEFMEHVIEEITIQARNSALVNQKSGVSARLSIANYETAVASTRRRSLLDGEDEGTVRMTDLGYLFASSSGKIELDPYRDESVTEYQVITKIIDSAVREVFQEIFPAGKYENTFDTVAKQIYELKQVEVSDQMSSAAYRDILASIPALFDLLSDRKWDKDDGLLASGCEFILEGLTSIQKLSRRKTGEIVNFKSVDVY